MGVPVAGHGLRGFSALFANEVGVNAVGSVAADKD
jgi:hypothetical protein